jgi:endonuclease/exonuclease/phosphatase family metal-dependent hydrolase
LTAPGHHRLRIVSYNVHACVGRDGRFMPERIADVVEPLDADFLALQEVEDRPFAGKTVSEFLGSRLGMHAYRGVTLRRQNADYGNLLLSKHEARVQVLHDISVPGGEPRGCIEVDCNIDDLHVRLFATHLGLRARERLEQVRLLAPALQRDDADLRILAGDINEWRPAGRVLRALHAMFEPAPRRRTFPSHLPAVALDRILVAPRHALADLRAVTTAGCRVASDHLPLVCDMMV